MNHHTTEAEREETVRALETVLAEAIAILGSQEVAFLASQMTMCTSRYRLDEARERTRRQVQIVSDL